MILNSFMEHFYVSSQVSLSVILEGALVTRVNLVGVVVLDVSVQGHLALQCFAALMKKILYNSFYFKSGIGFCFKTIFLFRHTYWQDPLNDTWSQE